MQFLKKKQIYLKASQVAVMIDCHPYQSRNEIMDTYHQQYFPDTFQPKENPIDTILQQAGTKSKKAVMDSMIKKSKDVHQLSALLSKSSSLLSSDPNLNAKDKIALLDYIKSNANKQFGIRNEAKAFKNVVATSKRILYREPFLFSSVVSSIDNCDYILRGKVDGIEVDEFNSKTVIEIKSRTKRLFQFAPQYEMIQIQTYLELLDINQAKLIEEFLGSTAVHSISRNTLFWRNSIEPGLQDFIKELHSLAHPFDSPRAF